MQQVRVSFEGCGVLCVYTMYGWCACVVEYHRTHALFGGDHANPLGDDESICILDTGDEPKQERKRDVSTETVMHQVSTACH